MQQTIVGESPGLYVHVPFCKTKCPYCDFYSITSRENVGEWLSAVQKEALLYAKRFSEFDTLYLGGGTPSSLADSELALLIESLRRRFSFSDDTEVTLECNPDDISGRQRLVNLQNLGINRISLGVQSLNDNELKYLGRRNTSEQNQRVLQWVRSIPSLALAVDLIYAFDGQSRQSWLRTLEYVLDFHPEHISCYQLTLEEDTPFGKMQHQGLIHPVSEDEQSDYFLMTSQYLEERGYVHYEISNFAIGPEHFSRHNTKYWRHVPYLGLGPAAHSFQAGVRWWNLKSVEQYCNSLHNGKAPIAGREKLSPEQLKLESLYLGLRTRNGVNAGMLSDSPRVNDTLAQLQRAGFVNTDNGRIIPTRKGFLLADSLPLMLLD